MSLFERVALAEAIKVDRRTIARMARFEPELGTDYHITVYQQIGTKAFPFSKDRQMVAFKGSKDAMLKKMADLKKDGFKPWLKKAIAFSKDTVSVSANLWLGKDPNARKVIIEGIWSWYRYPDRVPVSVGSGTLAKSDIRVGWPPSKAKKFKEANRARLAAQFGLSPQEQLKKEKEEAARAEAEAAAKARTEAEAKAKAAAEAEAKARAEAEAKAKAADAERIARGDLYDWEIESKISTIYWKGAGGGSFRKVWTEVPGKEWVAEPKHRKRLDHFTSSMSHSAGGWDDDDDDEGWDEEGWDEEYADPIYSAVQKGLDEKFGKGKFKITEIDDKGFVNIMRVKK
jgi:flagellar biosynthesis GTPase FlhF